MAKIKIDTNLYSRAKRAAEIAGYSSVEEFIIYIIEKELSKIEAAGEDSNVTDRLRGLGYID